MMRFDMNMRWFAGLLALLLLLPICAGASDCFECHKKGFSGKVVHQPVRNAECGSCHDPHASKHDKLLTKKESDLCLGCHQGVKSRLEKVSTLHAPVAEGKCMACHAPHASEFPNLLAKKGGDLCVGCHEKKEEYAVLHKPYAQGQCDDCHAAHGSDDYRMIKRSGSALCFACHKGSDSLAAKHLGRDMQKLDCLDCHNPHGGPASSLLRKVSHRPFAQGNCNACHGKQQGAALCLSCHGETRATFNKPHTHFGAGGTDNCVFCHNPHVGDKPALLSTNESRGCRGCHQATFDAREKMLHKHGGWNRCSDCHELHGSDSPAMLKGGAKDVCVNCHGLHGNFTHPSGDKALDPRNGRPVDCITCHDANRGTMFRNFLRGSGERGLCVQCHKSY